MKKIAMMNCLQSNNVCTGAGCLRAFYERSGGFACYEGEELQLVAFLRCSQCGGKLDQDEGMMEKLERLKAIATEAVHIGVCAQKGGIPCPYMADKAKWLEENGIQIIWKTH